MNKRKIETRTIAQAGFLIAISIVLTRFVSILVPLAGGLPSLRLGFGEIPLMISGLLFGPVVGGISGMIADLIGAWAFPQGPYFPGFTLSSILWGVLAGVYGLYLKKRYSKENPYTFKRNFVLVSISIVIISIFMNTYWLSLMMGKGFLVFLPGRLVSAVFNIPIQSYILTKLMKHLIRIIN